MVEALRAAGHLVHDWRQDDFSWQDIDPNYENWSSANYVAGLFEPVADRQFRANRAAIAAWCDTLVLILPCGRCAHAEFGFAAGQGKRTIILLNAEHRGPPDLMHRFADEFVTDIDDLLDALTRRHREIAR